MGEAEAAKEREAHGTQLVEPPEEAIRRLHEELDTVNDRYLRLAADFDNFRKRVARERTELVARAQGDLMKRMLDAMDDLARVAAFDADEVSVKDVVNGVQIVERKFLQELEAQGLERVGVDGEPFDPNHHEAVGTLPTADDASEGTVGAVIQCGFRLNGVLLRPARVMVLVADEDAGDDGGGAAEA
jgi:molecular chaperone GrpE